MVGLHDDAVRRLMTVAVEGRRFIARYGDDLRRLPLGRSEIGRCGECDRDQRKGRAIIACAAVATWPALFITASGCRRRLPCASWTGSVPALA